MGYFSDINSSTTEVAAMKNKVNELDKKTTLSVTDFGAVGDWRDSTQAFKDAMDACNFEKDLYIPPGIYVIKESIQFKARKMYGAGAYIDSGTKGTLIYFRPEEIVDLKPAFQINQGVDIPIEDFSVWGNTDYKASNLDSFINKELFDQDKYEMFSSGLSGFRITGSARVIFRNISTKNIKVGILSDSTSGHHTFYDCNIHGLIGIYIRKNSGDYFIQGGDIKGAFCGIMCGIQSQSNHFGGIDAFKMNRVHMGFSPYGIYQVKDADNYDSLSSVFGISGNFQFVRFEQIGEAAIKLLNKATSNNLSIDGFGFSWSRPNMTGEGWEYPLPDTIKPLAEKQRYAVYLGRLTNNINISADTGKLSKSTNINSLGSAYIHNLASSANLEGLDVPNIVMYTKSISSIPDLSDIRNFNDRIQNYTTPISGGNLLKNPEDIINWNLINMTIEVIKDASLFPSLTEDMIKEIGRGIKVIKLTPTGSGNPFIELPLSKTFSTENSMNFSMFVHTPNQFRTKLIATNNNSIYDSTINVLNKWTKIQGLDSKAPVGSRTYSKMTFESMSQASPTYICALRLTEAALSPYSPTEHLSTTKDIELLDSSKGIILRSEDGKRFKMTISNEGLPIFTQV